MNSTTPRPNKDEMKSVSSACIQTDPALLVLPILTNSRYSSIGTLQYKKFTIIVRFSTDTDYWKMIRIFFIYLDTSRADSVCITGRPIIEVFRLD
jgi:hypothetical protein